MNHNKCRRNSFREWSIFNTILFGFLLLGNVFAQPAYVTTIHPFEEILRKLVQGRGEVLALIPPAASPHTYELRPSEIVRVEKATAFFYGAENLDGWAVKISHANRIRLIDLLPPEYRLSADIYSNDHQSSGGIVDPHFWTDPLTVKGLLPALVEKLTELDPGGESIYEKNASIFAAELDSLYKSVKKELLGIKNRKVVLSHLFFQYYLNRFGFRILAVIEKSSAGEPSLREVRDLIRSLEKENAGAILTLLQLQERPAKVISESTGIPIIQLDPMGGVKGRETYRQLILYNTHKLRETLE